MSNTQIQTRDSLGCTFADPSAPDFTVRFKTTSTKKSLNGVSIQNNVHEIIVNDLNEISVGTTTATEALSLRVRISGSIESKDRARAIVNSIATQLPAWLLENSDLGFEPVTAPINPA